MTLPARLHDALFAPAQAAGLGRARALFYGFLFVWYGVQAPWTWASVPEELWFPIWPVSLLGSPPPGGVVVVLSMLFLGSLLMAASGLGFRVAGPLALVTGWCVLMLPQQYGRAFHQDAPVVMLLAILAFSRAGDGFRWPRWPRRPRRPRRRSSSPSPSGEYRWPLVACRVMLALVFLAAGLSKLRTAGLGWVHPEGLGFLLLDRSVTSAPWFDVGAELVRWPALLAVGGVAVLLVELTYPLALFVRRLRLPLVGAGLLLLLSFKAFLGPAFVALAAAHLWWRPWERRPGRAGR